MRLTLDDLTTGRLRLELPTLRGTHDVFDIARAIRVRGSYVQDARTIELGAIEGDRLEVSEVRLHLGAAGQLALDGASFGTVAVDARIALGRERNAVPFEGRVSFTAGEAREARLEMGGARLQTEVALERVQFQSARGEFAVEAAAIELGELRGHVAGASVAVRHASCTGVRAKRGEAGSLDVEVSDLSLQGVELEARGVRVDIERATLPGRTRFHAGTLSLEELRIDSARFAIDGIASPAASAPLRGNIDPSAGRRGQVGLDWLFLDALDGQLDVDLVVDARGPFLLRRVATHCFRVPVTAGTLNYRELERDLALLENMILDFAVRGGDLVLEKKLPLVPLEGQALVSWALGPDEHDLAARDRVRVRTLLGWRLPVLQQSKGPFSFEIGRLDFERIDARLRLAAQGVADLGTRGVLRLGSPEHPALGNLHVAGAVRHREKGPAEITQVDVAIEALCIGLDRFRIGRALVDVAELVVGALEDASVIFHGVTPASIRGTLRDLGVRRARVALGSNTND